MSDNRRKQHRPGFTLLELVVVLAILAVVTTLAIRSLDGLEDQSRYEKNAREFDALSEAVLGSPDDRAADGSRTVSGFVADMGRLPRAVADGSGNLTLAELWDLGGNSKFDVRQATAENVMGATFEDLQVYVPGGWRGPYLRLPIDATTWRDGWGNPMTSPSGGAADPNGTGYPHLRTTDDVPITSVNQFITGVRYLGANGRLNPADTGYDRDRLQEFTANLSAVTLAVQVDVLNGNAAATTDGAAKLTVRVFGPDPDDPSKIKITIPLIDPPQGSFSQNPVTIQFAATTGLTAGPRVVRAYFTDSGTVTTSYTKSAVKQITLRPGANFVNLTIDR